MSIIFLRVKHLKRSYRDLCYYHLTAATGETPEAESFPEPWSSPLCLHVGGQPLCQVSIPAMWGIWGKRIARGPETLIMSFSTHEHIIAAWFVLWGVVFKSTLSFDHLVSSRVAWIEKINLAIISQFCTSFALVLHHFPPIVHHFCTIFPVLQKLTKNISGSCSTSTFLWCWCLTILELSPRLRSTTMPSTRKTCPVISRLENVSIHNKTENVLFFQVKEYCPLVFRNLRERLIISKISISQKEFVSMASKYPYWHNRQSQIYCKKSVISCVNDLKSDWNNRQVLYWWPRLPQLPQQESETYWPHQGWDFFSLDKPVFVFFASNTFN